MEDAIRTLKEWLSASSSIVFFGGAGVSTESGIPDFRSADGLYNQSYRYPPETILSHTFFMSHTDEYYAFHKNRMIYLDAPPNAAHKALAALEEQGRLKAVVTQNIDGLHQKAGSRRVLELHGSVHRNYCMDCHAFYDAQYILASQGVPRCTCGGLIKPDVVLYEESLDSDILRQSAACISEADMLIVGGTSLNVYPAAGLVQYYQARRLVLINKSSTHLDAAAGLTISGSIGKVLGAAVLGEAF